MTLICTRTRSAESLQDASDHRRHVSGRGQAWHVERPQKSEPADTRPDAPVASGLPAHEYPHPGSRRCGSAAVNLETHACGPLPCTYILVHTDAYLRHQLWDGARCRQGSPCLALPPSHRSGAPARRRQTEAAGREAYVRPFRRLVTCSTSQQSHNVATRAGQDVRVLVGRFWTDPPTGRPAVRPSSRCCQVCSRFEPSFEPSSLSHARPAQMAGLPPRAATMHGFVPGREPWRSPFCSPPRAQRDRRAQACIPAARSWAGLAGRLGSRRHYCGGVAVRGRRCEDRDETRT